MQETTITPAYTKAGIKIHWTMGLTEEAPVAGPVVDITKDTQTLVVSTDHVRVVVKLTVGVTLTRTGVQEL